MVYKPRPRLTPSPQPAPPRPDQLKPKATPSPDYVYIPPPAASRRSNNTVEFPPLALWSQSPCLQDKCQDDFIHCVSSYDGCACYPGLLYCAQVSCPYEAPNALHSCHHAHAQRPSCRLECGLWKYPTRYSHATYKVVSSVRIQGTTAGAFAGSEYDFAQAVLAVVQTSPDKTVYFNEILDTRLVAMPQGMTRGNVPPTVLTIDFEVAVASRNTMQQVQRALEDDMIRCPSGASILANSLVEHGVLFNATQLSVAYALTAVEFVDSPPWDTVLLFIVVVLIVIVFVPNDRSCSGLVECGDCDCCCD
ncbi:Aste57867_22 [Aphanomyces stellatus]|uniref:Aste57867_22 protein n=1 Tax=Aphanomyces stellatus TaxID=120398 RepID=A0A485K6H4_9STRA|nr:hypothetical protein As57867_000022 [Aphanomyces stellatus]VFT77248.1 Aste57867_22 [Aphanomyces stellatus]